jgi:hypothetical protein
MTFTSDARFRIHHSLRIKGFSSVDGVSELAGQPVDQCETHLQAFAADGLALFREARKLWQLTPAGKEAHGPALEADTRRDGFREGIAVAYPSFLRFNEDFKLLCTNWQIRDGAPNDHMDPDYDAEVTACLAALHGEARSVVCHFGTVAERFADYSRRLDNSLERFRGGQTNQFTGVLCGSYHDVWMELHEDLLLTQAISRTEEGSF